MQYTNADILRMQRDAENRVRDMHKKSQQIKTNQHQQNSNDNSSHYQTNQVEEEQSDNVDETQSQTQTNSTHNQQEQGSGFEQSDTSQSPKKQSPFPISLLDGLNLSSDVLILVLLIFLLSKQEGSKNLILALCYILI